MKGAIWTSEEVYNLAQNQMSGAVHPYTCPNRGDHRHHNIYGDLGALVPTRRGWICPFCDYTQTTRMESSARGVFTDPLPWQKSPDAA